MTISPISPVPPAGSAPDAGDGPSSGLDAEFAALVGLSLGPTPGPGRGPGANPGKGTPTSAARATGSHGAARAPEKSEHAGDRTKSQTKDKKAAGPTGSGTPVADLTSALVAAQSLHPTAGLRTGTTGAPATAAGRAPAHDAPALRGGALTSPTPEVGAGKISGAGSPVLPATAHALNARRSEGGLTRSTPARPGAPVGNTAPEPVTLHGTDIARPAAGRSHRGHDAAEGNEHAASLPQGGSPSGPVTTAPPAPSPGATAPGATAPGAPSPTPGHPSPIADQVFGEVTRLVSRGDGTHRITLALHPADLGDVRVTLTLKDGSVRVSLAAGHDAQQALASGSPELHRLLHAAGAHSADIVVKDLPVQTASRFDLDPGAAHGGHGRGHTPDQAARTWPGDARDGLPAGATTPPSANPGTRTRSSGVDVSM